MISVRRITPNDDRDIELVAKFLSDEWGLAQGYSPIETHDWCRSVVDSDKEGLLVAQQNTVIAGTVMVVGNDLGENTDLTPWLSALYVLPAMRGTGIGRQLTVSAGHLARSGGAAALHLYARAGRLIDYYRALGWQQLYSFQRDSEDFVVMRKPLA